MLAEVQFLEGEEDRACVARRNGADAQVGAHVLVARAVGGQRGGDVMGHSNFRSEALNNKDKLIVRRAYGFHSANAALALVHLTCGPVKLTLPHEQRLG